MTLLANHLWQSTFCVLAVWLLTAALRGNRASVRYSLWLAASIKFLLPFSLLMGLGGRIPWRSVPAAAATRVAAIAEISQPFAMPATFRTSGAPPSHLPAILLTIWLAGIAFGLLYWVRTLVRIAAIQHAATPLDLGLSIPVRSTPARLEPGVFGIRHPVLILPAGIAERLTTAQLDAVLAHELWHARRNDNLTAAVHMLVETIFWFHPLVWWIRTQLVAERERACDEAVLARAADPRTYAEAILNVCKLCVESPLLCASGIGGGDLKARITRIVNRATGRSLTAPRKALLAIAAGAAIAVPLAIGSSQARPVFEVASVKLNTSPNPETEMQLLPGGKVSVRNISLKVLIALAWKVRPNMVFGAPGWLDSDHYDILAKAAPNATQDEMRVMMQALLADRFKLSAHTEIKELPGYAMVVAKTGSRLAQPDAEQHQDEGCEALQGAGNPGEHNVLCYVGMDKFAEALPMLAKGYFDRPVVNQTELPGFYKVKLNWVGVNQIDVTGGLTVFDAVEQLGLKLESRKVPLPSILIDHVDRTPTEN